MSETTIRTADEGDAAVLAELMGMLGYPTTSEAMAGRLRRIAGREDYATFVAAAPDVIGLVSVMTGWGLNQDAPYARIIALVVDERRRGCGAGAALVRAAEAWAREAGAGSIHLTTANHRKGAHAFYRRLGYDDTGRRFYRSLS